jgi:hypothetical protein
MQLDVHTMFVVTIAVTVILGCLLIYAWYQHRKIPALAWWGCAHMVASAGVWLVSRQGVLSDFWSIETANALLFVAAGMTWTGARLFDGNRVSLIGTFGGAAAWLLASQIWSFMSTSLPSTRSAWRSNSGGAAMKICFRGCGWLKDFSAPLRVVATTD